MKPRKKKPVVRLDFADFMETAVKALNLPPKETETVTISKWRYDALIIAEQERNMYRDAAAR